MDEKQSAHSQGCVFCAIVAPGIEAMMDHIWPENTRQHFRNARVEVLKGMRSLLDARIEHLSQHEQKGAKIAVE
jgi:predicted amidohydrolase